MHATADSRTIRRISADISGASINQLVETSWFPKSVKSRCPAIMLAARRTERVMGRIMLLMISMITIKGIRTGGVPEGTK